jgi:60 kDa SS-A/Ro ribonucleoprotein
MSDHLKAFEATKEKTKPQSRGGKIVASQVKEPRPDRVNEDGYPAYTPSEARDIFRITQCGIIGSQYYTSKEQQAAEALKKFESVAKSNPLFLLKALKLARQSNIKFSPKLGVVALSQNKEFCKQYWPVIVELLSTYHPGQLKEYVEMQKSYKKGFGYQQQGWITKVMKSWSNDKLEYFTIKYRKQLQVLLRLVHPNWNHELLNYVFDPKPGTAKGEAVGDRQKAFEELKAMFESGRKLDVDKAGRLLLEYRIDFNAAKALPCKEPRWWYALMMSTGTQGVLLNTRSFIDHGVFGLPGAYQKYEELLSVENVRKGRINPLDIIKTWMHIEDQTVKSILSKALVAAFDFQIAGIEDDVIEVSIDASASMRAGAQALGGGTTPYAYLLANIFAYSFYGKAREVNYTWFHTNNLFRNGMGGYPVWTGDRVKDMRSVFEYPYQSGYTNPSGIILEATRDHRHVDKFVVITDEAQNQGTPMDKAFLDYQKKVNPKALLVVINSSNSPWSAVPNAPNMVVYNAMTPSIFTAIGALGTDVESVINSVDLTVHRTVSTPSNEDEELA